MICEKHINIDLKYPYSGEVLRFHEGDEYGYGLVIDVYKDGTVFDLTGCTVKFDAVIRNYLAEFNEPGTIEDNSIIVPITAAMTAYPGILKIDIRIIKNEEILFFQTFRANVQPRVVDDSIVTPEGEGIADYLTRLDEKVDELDEDCAMKAPSGVEDEFLHNVRAGQYYYSSDRKRLGIKISESSQYPVGEDKIETYSTNEIDSKLAAIAGLSFEVVQALPTTNIKTNVIYLVPSQTATAANVYDEFIYVNNRWEPLGTTAIDLSNYALKSELPSRTSDLINDSGFTTGREDYCLSIPPVIYTGLNGETRIYYRNLLTANYLMYWGQYTNATTIAEKDEYVSLVGTAAATKNVAFKTFDRGYRQIESGMTSVVINSNPPANQTMLMLGDSFIDLGYIEPDLRTLFTAAGRTLTLIGTRGSGADKHEGYSGWKYTDFVTDAKAASNPFWNSGTGSFDFSYYMSQQGYSGLNSVFIQLGTNDAKPSSIQADFTDIVNAAQTIVSSILAYNSQIKIYLGLTVMPTLDCDRWAPKYNGIGVPWLLRYNMQRLNAALINAFKSNSSVKIVATNCILDSVTDINDNVHPNSAGFQKMAQQLYYTMMS